MDPRRSNDKPGGLSPSARRAARRDVLRGLAFVSPWLAGFLLFTLYPIGASLYYSFCDYRVLSPPRWVGIRNYVELFTDHDYFLPSLANTAFMFIELPLALIVSIAVALLLNQKLRGMGFFRTVYYLPSVVPTVASSILWLWLLNPEYGLVNKTLEALRIPTTPWLQSPLWSKPAFILLDLWMVGGGVVIYLAALQGVPRHLYEAADLDGAGPWHRTLHITLPAISPVIFFNLVLGVIGTFQYFTQAFLMTGSPPGGPANSTLFYALYLFQNAFSYFRMGYACAMAWVLFLLTLLATLVVFRSSARWVYYEGESR
ncbi:MAG: sugar ABC transporter permease [Chthonomonadales bacterium]|nr:sugar ABC transporter permease [Chthonomonadales bacterium]